MARQVTLSEKSRELRKIRLNQPQVSSEEARQQLEKNRSAYAVTLQSSNAAPSSTGHKAVA
jgi:hypothetical protein